MVYGSIWPWEPRAGAKTAKIVFLSSLNFNGDCRGTRRLEISATSRSLPHGHGSDRSRARQQAVFPTVRELVLISAMAQDAAGTIMIQPMPTAKVRAGTPRSMATPAR